MSKTQSPFEFDISRILGELKSPVADIEQIVSIQRRNFEAITAANQMTVEGIQSVVRRQAEIVRETLEDASSMLSDLTAAGTPEDKIIRQLERVKRAYDNAMSNVRELAELAAKSNGEAVDVVTNRISDSIDEIKSATRKSNGGRRAA